MYTDVPHRGSKLKLSLYIANYIVTFFAYLLVLLPMYAIAAVWRVLVSFFLFSRNELQMRALALTYGRVNPLNSSAVNIWHARLRHAIKNRVEKQKAEVELWKSMKQAKKKPRPRSL